MFVKCVCWGSHACMIIGNYRPSTNTLSRMDLCTLIDTLSISCGLSEGGGVYSVYIYIYIDYKYVSNVHVFVLFIHLAGRGRGYIIIEVYNHVN
jgi:hypothetical protein